MSCCARRFGLAPKVYLIGCRQGFPLRQSHVPQQPSKAAQQALNRKLEEAKKAVLAQTVWTAVVQFI